MEKYESIHGKDVSSFDFSSTHRLPTVSAAQALDDLKTDPQQFITTGLDALDRELSGLSDVSFEDTDGSQPCRGIQKGQIIEVWGPPASGKTTLAYGFNLHAVLSYELRSSIYSMQMTANTLRDGRGVVWVDTFYSLCHHRLGEMMSVPCSSPGGTTTSPNTTATVGGLVHYSTPTLAHLIGLLCKPGASSVPIGTSLVVIDGLPGLINRAFPRNLEPRQNPKGSGPAIRRLQVLQSMISAMQKLSATRDLLIVVLSQCATRMQIERGATLTPSIGASNWEQGIATRLVLFQDWTIVDSELRSVRLVGVQKSNNQASPNGIGSLFPFEICNGGLTEVRLGSNQPPLSLSTNLRHQKRKFNETDFEIADSEGEDYGWEDEDEAQMPNMPPQWQGSEDILIGHPEEDDNLTAETSEPEDD
ncbi:P-loop containing nucleoside triphosphate hydrolase protein [Nemania abortiva]|nr:P-loop containing nucleoside triphosphate hydrolase protein [Nemania abortiva]